MPPTKAEPKEKSENDILREELAAMRGELSAVTTKLNEANVQKVNAELATMTEGERRLLAEETAADNAIASAESEATALESQLAGLWAEGKFPEAASIQRKIAGAETRIQNETMRKQYLSGQRETLKAQRTTHAETPVPQQRTSAALPARIQQWIDSHPKFKSWKNPDDSVGYADKAYYHRAMAGHNQAEADGVQIGSDEYFRIVEEHTGDRQPEAAYSGANQGSFGDPSGDLYGVERPQGRAAGPGSMAAAPSRAAPGSPRPGRPPDLTADQREVADSLLSHIQDPAERYTRWAAFMERKGGSNGRATH